ncbi:hypothetical protein BKA70DRAFT_1222435 [Coprinopsis sp. MPI-PUGE-AT-0042]|nr:hypothetical protein BKA70DRAFT_1222435 [Coprinopsis sp. MPI-PUGE-AT-0042]
MIGTGYVETTLPIASGLAPGSCQVFVPHPTASAPWRDHRTLRAVNIIGSIQAVSRYSIREVLAGSWTLASSDSSGRSLAFGLWVNIFFHLTSDQVFTGTSKLQGCIIPVILQDTGCIIPQQISDTYQHAVANCFARDIEGIITLAFTRRFPNPALGRQGCEEQPTRNKEVMDAFWNLPVTERRPTKKRRTLDYVTLGVGYGNPKRETATTVCRARPRTLQLAPRQNMAEHNIQSGHGDELRLHALRSCHGVHPFSDVNIQDAQDLSE